MTQIDEAGTKRPKRWNWSWQLWGNRLLYSIAAGLVVNLATGIYALGTVIAVALFVLTTVIVEVRRR